jgi:hypothetical protein
MLKDILIIILLSGFLSYYSCLLSILEDKIKLVLSERL